METSSFEIVGTSSVQSLDFISFSYSLRELGNKLSLGDGREYSGITEQQRLGRHRDRTLELRIHVLNLFLKLLILRCKIIGVVICHFLHG